MFVIRMADINIRINNKYKSAKRLCADYIIDDASPIDMEISVTDEEIATERGEIDEQFSDGYCETIAIYRKICNRFPLEFDGFMLHGAFIECDGRGYVFSARSGTGKSTHVSIWKKVFGDKVRIINGDKPIVRVIDGKIIAYGTPWCGKENFGENASCELSAICFIERARENSIEEIEAGEAVTRIFTQIMLPEDVESYEALAGHLDVMLGKTPCYLLRCNMEDEAALVAYEKMKA